MTASPTTGDTASERRRLVGRIPRWGVALAVVLGVVVALVALLRGEIANRLVVMATRKYAPATHSRVSVGRLRLERVAGGFLKPTDLQFVPGRDELLVVLEQGGAARVVDLSMAGRDGVDKSSATFFRVEVRSSSELGLLGLAFHPAYPRTGLFYVNYTPADGKQRTVVSEWKLPIHDIGKRPAVETRQLLVVEQPYPNHNGGQLAFGPDGYLYIGLGDGGWKNDPHGHGQNLGTLLGSMLRIDVNDTARGPYGIPKDNPFVNRQGVRPEIWAYGLRNPWRFSFDPHGRLWIADVGQDRYEEIDIVERGDNLGWNVREGMHCFAPETDCPTRGLREPVFEYDRALGTSVTGGYVVTSPDAPSIEGKYVFGDFTSGNVWALSLPSPHLAQSGAAQARLIGKWPHLISTFGRDAAGRLYLADYAEGVVYRFVER